jgi:hypothetical protein
MTETKLAMIFVAILGFSSTTDQQAGQIEQAVTQTLRDRGHIIWKADRDAMRAVIRSELSKIEKGGDACSD